MASPLGKSFRMAIIINVINYNYIIYLIFNDLKNIWDIWYRFWDVLHFRTCQAQLTVCHTAEVKRETEWRVETHYLLHYII